MRKSAIAYVHPEVDWGFQARTIGVTAKSVLHDFLFEAYTRASVGDGLELRLRIEPVAGEHVGYLVLLSDEEKECDCGREDAGETRTEETGEGRQEEGQEGQEEGQEGPNPAAHASLPAKGVLKPKKAAPKKKATR